MFYAGALGPCGAEGWGYAWHTPLLDQYLYRCFVNIALLQATFEFGGFVRTAGTKDSLRQEAERFAPVATAYLSCATAYRDNAIV